MLHCIVATNSLYSGLDFGDSPTNNPNLTLFTDGSYLRGPQGEYQAGCAVASPVSILENGPLPNVSSAQQAELIALDPGVSVGKRKVCRYLVRTAAVVWERHMILVCFGNRISAPSGRPIKHGKQVAERGDAILLPCALALIKMPGH